jgi:hypothetical protein
MSKFVIRAVPFNVDRGQGGLGLLYLIYRRSLGLPAPWIDQSRRLFLYIIIQDRKIIEIIHFFSEMSIYGPGVRITTVIYHTSWPS